MNAEPVVSAGQDAGRELHEFAAKLYPICRSITGGGLRNTLSLIRERVPLEISEVPTGTVVYDWEVPLEWNVEGARVLNPTGEPVVEFARHNLHIVGYSEPIRTTVNLGELEPHLHSLPSRPGWIPYRTSYYKRNWGFCLSQEDRDAMPPGMYRVEIESSLAPGSLSYGELVLPGRSRDEVLFVTHVCHPSLANDNTSGIAVATALAEWVAGEPRRYTYRFLFAPGTIGSLCWLRRNESRLARIKAGLVLCLLGDPAPLTYKASRRGDTSADEVGGYVVTQSQPEGRVIPFEPYGYDERQFCSPGFDLPLGRLTRSVNGGYPEYHSSADDMNLIRPEHLAGSLEACKLFVTVLEDDRNYVNLSPKGEPRLGKRGLYGAVGGLSPAEMERAMLWVLNQSDGHHSLLDIARRSGLPFGMIRDVGRSLQQHGLLRTSLGPERRSGKRKSSKDGT